MYDFPPGVQIRWPYSIELIQPQLVPVGQHSLPIQYQIAVQRMFRVTRGSLADFVVTTEQTIVVVTVVTADQQIASTI